MLRQELRLMKPVIYITLAKVCAWMKCVERMVLN